jgi:hypothetical protein
LITFVCVRNCATTRAPSLAYRPMSLANARVRLDASLA